MNFCQCNSLDNVDSGVDVKPDVEVKPNVDMPVDVEKSTEQTSTEQTKVAEEQVVKSAENIDDPVAATVDAEVATKVDAEIAAPVDADIAPTIALSDAPVVSDVAVAKPVSVPLSDTAEVAAVVAVEVGLTQEDKQSLDLWLKKNKYKDSNHLRKGMRGSSKYPLHTAVKQKDDLIMGLLLRSGADVSNKNSAGQTAKQVAENLNINGSHDAVFKLLPEMVC